MEKSLTLLPDDVLLAVLVFLPPRQLMDLRLLCRRFRDVCLHPHLWRHVSLSSTRQPGLLLGALRLAPCLRSVSCRSADLQALAGDFLSTQCLIARLTLDVAVGSATDVGLAAAVVQHLGCVGGLSSITLSFRGTPTDNAYPLLRVVCSMDGITELSIFIDNNETLSVPWDDLVLKPSLTLLSYATRTIDPFLMMLLETHRSTLETVQIRNTCFPGWDSLPKLVPFPAALLNAMPKLRKLWCPPDGALSQLQALALDEVMLIGGMGREPFPQGALAFLRQAPLLRSVELQMPRVDPAAPVQALGGARSAGLIESLVLDFSTGCLDQVAAVFPRLPSLKTLSVVSKPPDSFLRAVSTASVPSLTELNAMCFDQCPHEWLHSPAVQDLLVRNQQLHLHIRVTAAPADEDCPCWWCHKDCHGDLKLHPWQSFSGHSKGPSCPDTCFQIAVPPCLRCGTRD